MLPDRGGAGEKVVGEAWIVVFRTLFRNKSIWLVILGTLAITQLCLLYK